MNIHAINFNSPGEVLLSEQRWKFMCDIISRQTTKSHTQAIPTWTPGHFVPAGCMIHGWGCSEFKTEKEQV